MHAHMQTRMRRSEVQADGQRDFERALTRVCGQDRRYVCADVRMCVCAVCCISGMRTDIKNAMYVCVFARVCGQYVDMHACMHASGCICPPACT